ncbi:MAG: hypothetical protein ABIJ56_24245 [Pseudomonadota bacterium]
MQESVHLGTINYFSSHEIVLGEETRIYGEGFVTGDVEIVFDGKWKIRAEHPVSGKVVVKGTAAGENEISFVLERDRLEDKCASHLFFQGRVIVRMQTFLTGKTGYIDAVRDRVKFDILDVEPSGKSSCRISEEKVDAFLDDLGLEVEEREEAGIEVVSVQPGKKASRAGLEPGDVIFVAGGMKAYVREDLLPPDDTQELDLAVFRPGNESLIKMAVPVMQAPEETDWRKNALIAFVFLLVVLLLQSRWVSSLLAKTVSLRLRPRKGKEKPDDRPPADGPQDEPPRDAADPARPGEEKLMDRLTAVLFSLVVVFPFVTLVALGLFLYGGEIHAAHACGAVFVLAFTAFVGESRARRSVLYSMMKRWVQGSLLVLPVVLVYVLRWLKTSSPVLASAAGDQMFHPWTWHGLEEPFALILLLAGLVAAVVPERRRTTWRRHIVMHLYSILVISLLVHCMMGGFEAPAFVAAYAWKKAMAVSVLIFISKVLLLYFAIQAISSRQGGGASPSILNASMLAVGSILAFTASLVLAPIVSDRISNLHYYTTATAFIILLIAAFFSGSRAGDNKKQHMAGEELRAEN